jgi:hypothetical protein
MATPPDFTVGQVLTSATMNQVGLWLVKSQTVGTTVASVTVTDAFPSDFTSFRVVYSGGVGSTLQTMQFLLGSSTTTYNNILVYSNFATPATPVSAGGQNQGQFEGVGYATTNYTAVSFDVHNPNIARYTTIANGSWVFDSGAGTFNGVHKTSTAYTSFILRPNSGTLTGGKINVYGYR